MKLERDDIIILINGTRKIIYTKSSNLSNYVLKKTYIFDRNIIFLRPSWTHLSQIGMDVC